MQVAPYYISCSLIQQGQIFFKKKVTRCSLPFLLYYNNTPFSAWLDKSILTTYLRLKLKWVRIRVVIKRRFKLLKTYLYLGVHLNLIFFFIRFVNG